MIMRVGIDLKATRMTDVTRICERTHRLIDSQDEVGGRPKFTSKPAPQDTDEDGMPDVWETKIKLDPKDPDDKNGDADKNGYTNVEEYLNSLCSWKER